jgi:hypothetical protein
MALRLQPSLVRYFGGVVELPVPDEPDFDEEEPVEVPEVLVVGSEVFDLEPDELELDPEELDDELVLLFEAVLEALAGAAGVVPAGVDNIGTAGEGAVTPCAGATLTFSVA